MPFAELEHTGLVDYVERHRTLGSTWAFLHLAKTAGTSLTHSLSRMAPPCHPLYLENYDLSREELGGLLADQPAYRVNQVWDGLYRRFEAPDCHRPGGP